MVQGTYRVIAVLLLLALATATASAQEATPTAAPPAFTIAPVGDHAHGWFDVTIDAGGSLDLVAGIRNTGEAPVALRAYAANAVNPPNGGFSAGTDEDVPAGATTWLAFAPAAFTLDPGATREVLFTVSVPPGTPPGEYVAALVVQTDGSHAIPGTEALRQVIRSTVSVEITVPGEMTTGFTLGDPVVSSTAGQWVLDVPITNTGTARVRPQGDLVLTDATGAIVTRARIEMGSVYGGNATSARVALLGQLPAGDYRVSVDFTDPATGAAASLADRPVTLATAGNAPAFRIDSATVTPTGAPVQYATAAVTVTNTGQAIPAASVVLVVTRDGAELERYPLAEGQALPTGDTEITQRYVPVDGWQPGAYAFRIEIASVTDGAETALASADVGETIAIP